MEVDATTFNRITAALPQALEFTEGLVVRRGDQCSPWQESSADQGLVRQCPKRTAQLRARSQRPALFLSLHRKLWYMIRVNVRSSCIHKCEERLSLVSCRTVTEEGLRPTYQAVCGLSVS